MYLSQIHNMINSNEMVFRKNKQCSCTDTVFDPVFNTFPPIFKKSSSVGLLERPDTIYGNLLLLIVLKLVKSK